MSVFESQSLIVDKVRVTAQVPVDKTFDQANWVAREDTMRTNLKGLRYFGLTQSDQSSFEV